MHTGAQISCGEYVYFIYINHVFMPLTGLLSLFAGIIIFGLGTARFANTRYTALSVVYPERDSTANGITSAAGNTVDLLLLVTAVVTAGYLSWKASLGLILLFFFWPELHSSKFFREISRSTLTGMAQPPISMPST